MEECAIGNASGFRIYGLGFSLGFRIYGLGCRLHGVGFDLAKNEAAFATDTGGCRCPGHCFDG